MAFKSKKNGNIITIAEAGEMYEHFRIDIQDQCKTFDEYLDKFFRNGDFEEIDEPEEYTYGMRLRGFSIGCQPMSGFIRRMDDDSRRYHDLLIYNRKLTDSELTDYELDYLGETN